ncbi:glycosyltransferase family 39 protein [Tautonia sociabilis]|uniref:Glycosyltransferase RgtA/B/C/D-like domain-containing protein n=1 Tax=Tautonia sociabilis TaxID=2080755 RepID=A0A432MJF2_9BACT|nr:glycosyltransferase family 39 protein [Tautonia sociabilis]RUL87522.1 hypothetical protein TsocGM_11845 [Tautonia sociabilis]
MASRRRGRIELEPWVGPALRRFGTPGVVVWSLVAVGVALRVIEYAHGRAFWLDEYSLWTNIEGMGPLDLLRPTKGGQLVPPGFLALERMAAELLGGSVRALRLVPMVAGVAALVAFRPLADRALGGAAATMAVGAFALSGDLIYFGAELKPYIVDVAAAVGALWFGVGAVSGRRRAGERASAAVFGAAVPWLAFASGFVVPAVALAWVWSAARRKDREDLAWAVGCGALWGVSGLGSLMVARAMLGGSDHAMQVFWEFAFLPIPPRSVDDLRELAVHALNLFAGPGRLAFPVGRAASAVVGLGLAGIGAARIARNRGGGVLALLLMPGLLHAMASAVRVYPFHGRLALYLVVPLLLLIGGGLGAIWERWPSRRARAALVVFAFVLPTIEAAEHLTGPHLRNFDPHGDLRPDPF